MKKGHFIPMKKGQRRTMLTTFWESLDIGKYCGTRGGEAGHSLKIGISERQY